MLRFENDQIVFSSGRTAYVNRGIVGLSPKLGVSEGYDGGFQWDPPEARYETSDEDSGDLTDADMIELVDHMIERWIAFKNKLTPE